MTSAIDYVRGVPGQFRAEAAALYDAAFGPKLRVAVLSDTARRELLEEVLQPSFAIAALRGDRLVGLAGFHTSDGSLTGGLGFEQLLSRLGTIKGCWAALIFSFYEREPQPGELLMDGISVHPDMRGRGVGTRLLDEVAAFAAASGCDTVRLDVIDTNPGARRLYERNGFVAVSTQRFGVLRWLLGFGASTTMIRAVDR